MSFLETISPIKDVLKIICEYLNDDEFRSLIITCKTLFDNRHIRALKRVYSVKSLASFWMIGRIKIKDDNDMFLLDIFNKYNVYHSNIYYVDVGANIAYLLELDLKNITCIQIDNMARFISLEKFTMIVSKFPSLQYVFIAEAACDISLRITRDNNIIAFYESCKRNNDEMHKNDIEYRNRFYNNATTATTLAYGLNGMLNGMLNGIPNGTTIATASPYYYPTYFFPSGINTASPYYGPTYVLPSGINTATARMF